MVLTRLWSRRIRQSLVFIACVAVVIFFSSTNRQTTTSNPNRPLANQSIPTANKSESPQSGRAPSQPPGQKQFLASFPLHRGTRIDHRRRHSKTSIIPTPHIILEGKHGPLSQKLQEKRDQREDDKPPQMNHGHQRQVADITLYKGLKTRLDEEGLTEEDCRCGTFRRVQDDTPRRAPAPHWKLSMERLTGDAWDWSEGRACVWIGVFLSGGLGRWVGWRVGRMFWRSFLERKVEELLLLLACWCVVAGDWTVQMRQCHFMHPRLPSQRASSAKQSQPSTSAQQLSTKPLPYPPRYAQRCPQVAHHKAKAPRPKSSGSSPHCP